MFGRTSRPTDPVMNVSRVIVKKTFGALSGRWDVASVPCVLVVRAGAIWTRTKQAVRFRPANSGVK